MEFAGDIEALKPVSGLRNEAEVLDRLGTEVGLKKREAELYLRLLGKGYVPAGVNPVLTKVLIGRGMAILSGDGKRVIPVHPRLGIANHYRTWREQMVREINERRMRVDKLILELIPIYEAATERKSST